MQLFLFYMRQKKKMFFSYLLFCMIFSLTFYLYHLPIEAVIYPFFICGLLGFLFILLGFVRFTKKHLLLQNLQVSSANLLEELPEIATIEDKDYQKIIKLLCDARQWF